MKTNEEGYDGAHNEHGPQGVHLQKLLPERSLSRFRRRRSFEGEYDDGSGKATDWEIDIEAPKRHGSVKKSTSRNKTKREHGKFHDSPPPGDRIRERSANEWPGNSGEAVRGANNAG